VSWPVLEQMQDGEIRGAPEGWRLIQSSAGYCAIPSRIGVERETGSEGLTVQGLQGIIL